MYTHTAPQGSQRTHTHSVMMSLAAQKRNQRALAALGKQCKDTGWWWRQLPSRKANIVIVTAWQDGRPSSGHFARARAHSRRTTAARPGACTHRRSSPEDPSLLEESRRAPQLRSRPDVESTFSASAGTGFDRPSSWLARTSWPGPPGTVRGAAHFADGGGH